jgi:hypothetical protein
VADLRRAGNRHAVNAYACAHQEWMLSEAWGPLLTSSIALLAPRGGINPAPAVAVRAVEALA